MMKKWLQVVGPVKEIFFFCICGLLLVQMDPALSFGQPGGSPTLLENTAYAISAAQGRQTFTFGEVVDGVDLRKNTKFSVKEFARTAIGTEIQWQGQVLDVLGGRGKARVLVANKARKRYKGYNIVLVVISEIEKAAALKKGAHITFAGVIQKIKPLKRGGGAIVTVNDIEFLD